MESEVTEMCIPRMSHKCDLVGYGVDEGRDFGLCLYCSVKIPRSGRILHSNLAYYNSRKSAHHEYPLGSSLPFQHFRISLIGEFGYYHHFIHSCVFFNQYYPYHILSKTWVISV